MITSDRFEMVAKTFQGLEDVLAEELRGLGAENVVSGKRMVSFSGDLAMLYKANLCCRTALRILKPFYRFTAKDPDELYEQAKEYDWASLMTIDKTFAIDTVAFSDEFKHSRYVTYRVKDAIVDWFKDRFGEDKRPGVRLQDADVLINVHISGCDVTLSLDSSGESLHKRGYRVAQTEAPINEVLAAGIILKSGWRGDVPFVDPMCGSGTFLCEAAMIAANINPGVYRRGFAFERWRDFDSELFDSIYNDDSAERAITVPIVGCDISPKAVDIAVRNLKGAGVAKYVDVAVRPLSAWTEAPQPAGVLVTNPPYGERISAPDMDALYELIGSKLKHVFTGYHAWIIGYRDEYFRQIGLAPSSRTEMLNGSLECELREYVIFEGDRKSFVAAGGKLKAALPSDDRRQRREERAGDSRRRSDRRDDRRFGRKERDRSDDRFGRHTQSRRDDRREDTRDVGARSVRGRFDSDNGTAEVVEPENPFAKRRNLHALKSISGRTPKLPPVSGPVMRSRGWKKRPADDDNNNNTTE